MSGQKHERAAQGNREQTDELTALINSYGEACTAVFASHEDSMQVAELRGRRFKARCEVMDAAARLRRDVRVATLSDVRAFLYKNGVARTHDTPGGTWALLRELLKDTKTP